MNATITAGIISLGFKIYTRIKKTISSKYINLIFFNKYLRLFLVFISPTADEVHSKRFSFDINTLYNEISIADRVTDASKGKKINCNKMCSKDPLRLNLTSFLFLYLGCGVYVFLKIKLSIVSKIRGKKAIINPNTTQRYNGSGRNINI